MAKIRLLTLPNVITLGNLACGVAAIAMFGIRPSMAIEWAFWLMCAAAVFDFVDGFVARALKQVSPVGKQLDSLCDMVSFGVLPTMLAIFMYIIAGGRLWWCVALIGLIALASALRLAKFNVDESQSTEFVGLPTPACALLIASVVYWCAGHHIYITTLWIPWAVVGGAVVLAWLLVSPIRMTALKFHGWGVRENWLRYLIIAVGAGSIAIFGVLGVAFAIVFYILVSIIKILCIAK